MQGVDPLSPSLVGAPRRRGLSADATRAAARALFVALSMAKLASLDGRVGMPPAQRDALRQLIHRKLAPLTQQLTARGGATDNNAGPAEVPAAGAFIEYCPGAAAHHLSERHGTGSPAERFRAEAGALRRDADASRPAVPISALPAASLKLGRFFLQPRPRAFSDGGAGMAGKADASDGDRAGADSVRVAEQVVAIMTVSAQPPGSDRATTSLQVISYAPATPEGERSPPDQPSTTAVPRGPKEHPVPHSRGAPPAGSSKTGDPDGVPLASSSSPTVTLDEAFSTAVGRAPGGADGALSLSVAIFLAAAGAVAEATASADTPRHSRHAVRASAEATHGRRSTAPATAAAGPAGLAAASPCPPPLRYPADRRKSGAGGTLALAPGLPRAPTTNIATLDASESVVCGLREATRARPARPTPTVASLASAPAASTDAASAAAVRLFAESVHGVRDSAGWAAVCHPTDGARSPPPTPAAMRRAQTAPVTALPAFVDNLAPAGPKGIDRSTRESDVRVAAVAPVLALALSVSEVLVPLAAVAPAAHGRPGTMRAGHVTAGGGGTSAQLLPRGRRVAIAQRSTAARRALLASAPALPATPQASVTAARLVAPAVAPAASATRPRNEHICRWRTRL